MPIEVLNILVGLLSILVSLLSLMVYLLYRELKDHRVAIEELQHGK